MTLVAALSLTAGRIKNIERSVLRIVERRRWLASQQLWRVDGSDNSATIFDQKSGEFTLLNTASRTYRTLDTPKRMSPQKGSTLKRSGESKIAGLNCSDCRMSAGSR
jgi:hypothetical protein